MCRVDITMYKDCVHHKTGSPKTTPCSHGLNPTTNGCNVGFCDLRPVILDKPSYCPECYREKVSRRQHLLSFLTLDLVAEVIGAARETFKVDLGSQGRLLIESC